MTKQRPGTKGGAGWVVKKPGSAKPLRTHRSQSSAEQKAKAQVARDGGGEVRVHGSDGRIRDSDTVGRGGRKLSKSLAAMSGAELAAAADEVEERARRAAGWTETDSSRRAQAERVAWLDAETTAVSIRFPTPMLDLLRAIAEREGVGYQTLIKRWLADRIEQIAQERAAKREELAAAIRGETAAAREAVAALARSPRRS